MCEFVLDPHSMVRLADKGNPGSTYINANFIRVSVIDVSCLSVDLCLSSCCLTMPKQE